MGEGGVAGKQRETSRVGGGTVGIKDVQYPSSEEPLGVSVPLLLIFDECESLSLK